MKKPHIFLLVAFLGIGTSTFSQSTKMMFHAGFTYEFFPIKEVGAGSEVNILSFYGLAGGMNYVLMHSNDQFSLLANPNLALGYTGGYNGPLFMVQAPVFLSARVGAGSTPFNENKFGFGVGAGVNVNYLYGTFYILQLNHTLFLPSAMAEFQVNGSNSLYSIRLHLSIMPEQVRFKFNDYNFSNFGLSINYAF